jgi:hypothetical protein
MRLSIQQKQMQNQNAQSQFSEPSFEVFPRAGSNECIGHLDPLLGNDRELS